MSKEEYFEAAQDWETGDYLRLQKSNTLGWRIAGVVSVIALVQAVTIAGLTPLKEKVPYVINQNETTGVTEVAKSLTDAKTTWAEVTKKADLRKYVRSRESYSRPLAAQFYSTVGVMSSQEEAQRYQEFYNPKLNKKGTSPLQKYGDVGTVLIRIKSTSLVSDKVASVNYVRIERPDQLAMTKPIETEWVATITYRYGPPPANEDDREINPTGIQVVEYRNDPVDPNANEAK